MADVFPDAGAVAWMHSYARKNYWRVAAWMDYDDLIQEGYKAYYEVRWRYPTAIEPAHIMSLFKLCYCCLITDLSRARTKQQDDARSDIVEVYDGDAVTVPDTSEIQMLLIKAPQIVKEVISLLTDDKNLELLSKPFEKKSNGRRETLNERVCKVLGLNSEKIDAIKNVRMYLLQSS